MAAAQISFRLLDISHLEQKVGNLPVTPEKLPLGPFHVRAAYLTFEDRKGLLRIACKGVLQTGKLLQATHKIGVARAPPDLHGLVAILHRVVQPAKLRASVPARVIEPRQIAPRCTRRRRRICGGLEFLEQGGIRLLGIEDRGDVSDGARWRHKSRRQRAELGRIELLFHRYCNGDVGAPVGRSHCLFNTHFDFRCCLRPAYLPNGFSIRSITRTHAWSEAPSPHALLDKRLPDGIPALLACLLGGQTPRWPRCTKQDCPGDEQRCGLACYRNKRLRGGKA